jgi:hypothetical protein
LPLNCGLAGDMLRAIGTEKKDDSNVIDCDFGAHSFGLFTSLAVQHGLGILPERWTRSAAGHRHRADCREKDLTRTTADRVPS